MTSALELMLLEWRPSSLRDIDDLPHQVMEDYWSIREGQAVSREPFAWYRSGDRHIATVAHLFRVEFDGPADLARCGAERDGPPSTYRRDTDERLFCQRCSALQKGSQPRVGTIGDLEDELKGA